MKKRIFVLTIILLCLFLCACNDGNNKDVATYIFNDLENEINYNLSVDYNKSTFNMEVTGKEEYIYLGTFINKNGYLILESVEKGSQKVIIKNDNFYFEKTEENNSNNSLTCEHELVIKEENNGNCEVRGYIIYECSKCGYNKKEYKDYGEHDYIVVSYKEGDCCNKGKTTYKCKYCENERTVTDENYGNHKLSGNEYIIDKGCCEHLINQQSCTVCKEIIKEEKETYGSHDFVDGICQKCKYTETGFFSEHVDENNDGVYEQCGYKKEIIDTMINEGFYRDNNVFYYGFYPQKVSEIEASVIKENGILDSKTGYYRYENNSYLIAKTNIKIDMSFSNGKEIKKDEEYAFILEPIKWYLIEETNDYYSIYAEKVLDKKEFLLSIYQQLFEGKYYNVYNKRVEDNILSNNYEHSMIKEYINGTIKDKILGEKEKEYLYNGIKILSRNEIENNNISAPKMSDYALIKGISGISLKSVTGKDENVANVFTNTIDEENSNNVYCLTTDGLIKSKTINSNYGVIMKVEIKKNIIEE